MDIQTLLLKTLKLSGDEWLFRDIEVDYPSNRIDITVSPKGAKKFWLWRTNNTYEHVALRHLPMFGMRTFLHVPDPAQLELKKDWGHIGSQCTYEMELFVVTALKNCNSIKNVVKITELLAEEIRKIGEINNVSMRKILMTT